MKHLKALAQAGLTTVHLLPLADIATINEDKSTWQQPACDLRVVPAGQPSSSRRACPRSPAHDGFNWGYDPLHYTTPEGSYAPDPDGRGPHPRSSATWSRRSTATGLRVVMDMVYNHTTDSGQTGKNDPRPDRARLLPPARRRPGTVETSTCCANTATEHAMMGKLMVDSVLTWAKEYKVDGFRFDLMGHQPKALMRAAPPTSTS